VLSCYRSVNILLAGVFRLRSSRELQQQVDHLKSSLECAAAEQQKLEQIREGLEDQLDTEMAEHHRLKTANCELQRQIDLMNDEKEDLSKDVEQQQRDSDRWYMVSTLCLYIMVTFALISHYTASFYFTCFFSGVLRKTLSNLEQLW